MKTQTLALAGLAAEINAAHDEATAAAVTTLEKAQYCGRWLIQAKEQVGHGNFTTWLKENTRVSDRTARRYMTLARGWTHLKTDTMADLNLAGALKAIRQEKARAKYSPMVSAISKPAAEKTAAVRDIFPGVVTVADVPRDDSPLFVNARIIDATRPVGPCPHGGEHTPDDDGDCTRCFEPGVAEPVEQVAEHVPEPSGFVEWIQSIGEMNDQLQLIDDADWKWFAAGQPGLVRELAEQCEAAAKLLRRVSQLN